MVREWLIEIYLFLFKCFFYSFKVFPLQHKIVIVASFKENNLYIFRELEREQFNGRIVFLCKKSCIDSIRKTVQVPVFLVEAGKLLDELLAAYHLATAKTIIVDNYYGFLAAIEFKKDAECIQIWHAAGAIKKFGIMDLSVRDRTERAKRRFLKVYNRFDKVVVGSRAFAKLFEQAFQIKEDQFLPFGYPRTDFFFDRQLQEDAKKRFFAKHPDLKAKKIILYAPTFRPKMADNRLELDFEKLYATLHDEYVFLVRLHPAVAIHEIIDLQYKDFVFDFSRKASINELLVAADMLITDYSSIPFEYVFLKKPMIFYPYDISDYVMNPGLWENYEDMVPGPVVYSTDEIIEYIKKNEFDVVKYETFQMKWNEYSLGNSSRNLVQYIQSRHLALTHSVESAAERPNLYQ